MSRSAADAPRRVLIVAYYFPPMGLSGVQRVSKFAKYLPEFGWHPTVLTVEPGGYFAFDPSLSDDLAGRPVDVVRTASFDPTRLFGGGRTVSLPREGVRSTLSVLSQFVFVPDNKIGWYPAAVREGRRLLDQQPFDAILSSAPPYTAHLIAAALKRHAGLPLLLDFRDDWVGNPRHVYPTPVHRRLQSRLERSVLRQADGILTINRHIARALKERHPLLDLGRRMVVVPQGYDPSDFDAAPQRTNRSRLTLLYTGVFYDAQTPEVLLRAVARLVETQHEVAQRLRLAFVGLLPDWAMALARALGIDSMIHHAGYLTHAQTVERMKEADALWLVVGRRAGAEGISTGKLFEYIGSRRPILGLVPVGEARDALTGYGAAYIADPDDVGAVSQQLARLYQAWRGGTLPTPREKFVTQFDRRELASVLARRLNHLTPV